MQDQPTSLLQNPGKHTNNIAWLITTRDAALAALQCNAHIGKYSHSLHWA